MPKVMVSFYNTKQVGGPSAAMNKLVCSKLSEKYDFVPIIINEHLGKFLKVKVVRRLASEIKAEDPDVIYYTGLQLQGFYIALAAKLAGYGNRTVMVVRGSSCDAMNVSLLFKFVFGNIIEPLTCRWTRITHTVCREMADNPIVKNNVVNFGGVIHNAAPLIHQRYKRDALHNEIGANNNEIVLVYTGRIIEDKGIGVLLDAMKSVGENIKLILVGDGAIENYQEKAKELRIDNRVLFLGRRNDVLDILSGSDIFVFPTLHENLSNSLLEACSMGLPVIASNVGGNPEVIRDGIDGLLVSAKNVDELVAAINKLSLDGTLRKTMGDNAKKRMETEFSQEKIFGQIEELFMEIINGEGGKNNHSDDNRKNSLYNI